MKVIAGKQYYETRDVMEITGVPYSTICQWLREGTDHPEEAVFPDAFKLFDNSGWLIPVDSVEGWETRRPVLGRPKEVQNG